MKRVSITEKKYYFSLHHYRRGVTDENKLYTRNPATYFILILNSVSLKYNEWIITCIIIYLHDD